MEPQNAPPPDGWQPPVSDPPPQHQARPLQFGLRDLMILVTVAAVAMSLTVAVGLRFALFAAGLGLFSWLLVRMMGRTRPDFVVVWEGPSPVDAHLRAAELVRHKIQAIAHDGQLPGLPGLPGGVPQVIVPARDADRARRILDVDAVS